MSSIEPLAPLPADEPVPAGTRVELDPSANFLGSELIAGGSPWRLLRLSGSAVAVAKQWLHSGSVQVGQEGFARTLTQQGLLEATFEPPKNLDDLAVVIPVRDNPAGLKSILSTLVNFDVTVVDDGTADPSVIRGVTDEFNVRLVRHDVNRGPGAARNSGVNATERAFVWFIDSDVSMQQPVETAKVLRANFNDPTVAAVAPRVAGVAGTTAREGFEHRHGPLDLGSSSALVAPRGRVAYVPSASLMVRRSALGYGFDENLRTGEDVDLVWRLIDRGWLVRYDASVVVEHRARTSWRSWFMQRCGYGASAGPLALRHGDRLAPIRVDAWTLAAWSAALAGQRRIAFALIQGARRVFIEQLPGTVEDGEKVADEVVVKGIVRAGGPLARATVRSYGPLLLLAAVHPKLRRGALAIFMVGTAWRWHDRRGPFVVSDVALAVADDAAYAGGVWTGAVRSRSWRAVTPRITFSTSGLRAALGRATATPPTGLNESSRGR